MNELHVANYNGVEVVDSREVSQMADKNHKHLLRDIRGYIDIMEKANELDFEPVGGQSKFGSSDFFLESS